MTIADVIAARAAHGGLVPTPSTPDTRWSKRRFFAEEYKSRILDEYEYEYENATPGERRTLLRREGLHYTNISSWRRKRMGQTVAAEIVSSDLPVDIYARVSQLKRNEKREPSTDGQVSVCRVRLADLGLAEGKVLVDPGRSAGAAPTRPTSCAASRSSSAAFPPRQATRASAWKERRRVNAEKNGTTISAADDASPVTMAKVGGAELLRSLRAEAERIAALGKDLRERIDVLTGPTAAEAEVEAVRAAAEQRAATAEADRDAAVAKARADADKRIADAQAERDAAIAKAQADVADRVRAAEE